MHDKGLSKEEVFAFLLTHVVVDRGYVFEMTPMSLFKLMNLASEAENRLQLEHGLIPHEVIEEIAEQFVEQN